MLNPIETLDTHDAPLSPGLDAIPSSRVIVALLQITVVTLVVCLLSTLFPGERS